MEKSGIIDFILFPIGRFRLDAGGLRLVDNLFPDPDFQPRLDQLIVDAFKAVDGAHILTQDAVDKLPEQFGLPKEALDILDITNVPEAFPLPPDGAVF